MSAYDSRRTMITNDHADTRNTESFKVLTRLNKKLPRKQQRLVLFFLRRCDHEMRGH